VRIGEPGVHTIAVIERAFEVGHDLGLHPSPTHSSSIETLRLRTNRRANKYFRQEGHEQGISREY
jgi:hypothetical protein